MDAKEAILGIEGRAFKCLAANPDRSPLLAIDLDVVAQKYFDLASRLPAVGVFYAVKANPAPEILELLVSLGSSFDVASLAEVDAALAAGAPPERLSFGNTIKKQSAIRRAFELGVNRFAFDSESELDKLIASAPGSTVFCRLLCDGFGSAWPLSRKFGCTTELAVSLLKKAAAHGMKTGVSFHVGSQQFDVNAWDRALAAVADIRAELRYDGIELQLVNLGGGLPGSYVEPTPDLADFTDAIQRAVEQRLGPTLPAELLIEPGRFLVADAGLLRCEVVTVGTKSVTDRHRWVYLDVGMFSGLFEAMEEGIRYPILTSERLNGRPEGPTGPVVLAGPTCDSADVLYQETDYQLPLSLGPGDSLYFQSVGAYSTTFSTVGFNGFAPLDVEVIPLSDEPVTVTGPTEGV